MASVFSGSGEVLTVRGMKLNWRLGQSVLCCVNGKLEVMRFLLGTNTIVLSAKDSNPWREGRHPFPLFFPFSPFLSFLDPKMVKILFTKF